MREVDDTYVIEWVGGCCPFLQIKRTGSGGTPERVYRRCHPQHPKAVAQTPYHRILSSPHIPDEIKMKLEKLYDKLNPAELKREISRLQNELYRLNSLKQNIDREIDKSKKAQNIFDYIST